MMPEITRVAQQLGVTKTKKANNKKYPHITIIIINFK